MGSEDIRRWESGALAHAVTDPFGQGPVPWEHEPNRGFLRSLAVLSRAAGLIGEDDEERRCADFLRDSSTTGARELGL